jgi:hypothetical protein
VPLRPRVLFRAVDFRPVDFRVVDFRVVDFRVVDFRVVDFRVVDFRAPLPAFRFRVAAAFLADAERADLLRVAEARPPFLPPFRDAERVVFLPRPEPLFFPPPVSLFTVAHARRSASFRDTP